APREQVRGREDVVEALAVLLAIEEHDPARGRRVPEDLRVALGMNEDGIPVVVPPGAPAVEAVGNAVRAVVITRPEGDKGRSLRVGAEAGGVRCIHDTRTRLHAAVELLLPEGRLQLGPVNEIRADGVNPAFVPALREE